MKESTSPKNQKFMRPGKTKYVTVRIFTNICRNNYRYWTSYYGLPVAGWNAGNGGENYFNIKG